MRSMQILLNDIWQIKRPNLLISVTGGAKRLTLNPRLKSTFKDGLMRAAASTGRKVFSASYKTVSTVILVILKQIRFDFHKMSGTFPYFVQLSRFLTHDREDLSFIIPNVLFLFK